MSLRHEAWSSTCSRPHGGFLGPSPWTGRRACPPPLRDRFHTIVKILGIDGGQRDDHHFEVVELKEHVWSNLSEMWRFPGGLLEMTRAINCYWDLESIAAFCLNR